MQLSKRSLMIAALVAAVWLALGAASPAAALAGSTRIVDDNYPSPGACHGAGFATIQAAVDSFAPGQSGTIRVCAGTYTENVSMTGLGKIKLVGSKGAVITPAASTQLVSATNTQRLTVQGFTLDGASIGVGAIVYLVNTSGVVTRNTLQNAFGSYGVFAIYNNGGAATLNVIKNKFTSISGGLNALVAGGGVLSVKVTGNDMTNVQLGFYIVNSGATATAVVTRNRAQGTSGNFGVQVQRLNKVTISKNTLDNFSFGIQVVEVGLAKVIGNKMRSTQYGIILGANLASSSNNKIQGNTIEAAGNLTAGIYVATGGAAFLNGTQVKGNKITDPSNSYVTIGILLSNPSGTLDGTQIKGNKLTNMDVPYTHTGDTNTVISGNHCTPASPCVAP